MPQATTAIASNTGNGVKQVSGKQDAFEEEGVVEGAVSADTCSCCAADDEEPGVCRNILVSWCGFCGRWLQTPSPQLSRGTGVGRGLWGEPKVGNCREGFSSQHRAEACPGAASFGLGKGAGYPSACNCPVLGRAVPAYGCGVVWLVSSVFCVLELPQVSMSLLLFVLK